MPEKLGSIDPIHVDGDQAVAWAAPLIVQIRRGPMTLAVLDAIERKVRWVKQKLRPQSRVAALIVLEESAMVLRDDLRAAQRRIIAGLMDGLDVRISVAVVGHGLTSTLQRAVARGIGFANPRIRVAASPEEAAAWVAPHLGVERDDVIRVVADVRSRGL